MINDHYLVERAKQPQMIWPDGSCGGGDVFTVCSALKAYHNQHVQLTQAQNAAQDQRYAEITGKLQAVDGKLAGNDHNWTDPTGLLQVSLAAHRTEINSLQKQLDDTNARQQAQKAESDTEIRQLKASVQELMVANRKLLEMVKKGQSDSNSFYESSDAGDPRDIDEDLGAALVDLETL